MILFTPLEVAGILMGLAILFTLGYKIGMRGK